MYVKTNINLEVYSAWLLEDRQVFLSLCSLLLIEPLLDPVFLTRVRQLSVVHVVTNATCCFSRVAPCRNRVVEFRAFR